MNKYDDRSEAKTPQSLGRDKDKGYEGAPILTSPEEL